MVYTTALLFGHGVPGMTEEDSVLEMMEKYFFQLTPPGPKTSSARRGSVESCEDRENCSSCKLAPPLHCQVLLLPRHVTTRVGQDVVRSSADEPCGLRGASIQVYVDCKDGLKSVGSVFPDPSVTPTFELSVIFKADKDGGWPPLRRIFDTNKVLKLRAEYRLVKRKLYSSASPVIHDFN
uniref:DNA damage-inducible transcript 4-like protein n=1 Tax=Monopterus albus TaxID=43700 RepID=A0A3Q3QN59_MONAL